MAFNALTLLPGARHLRPVRDRLERRILGTGGTISARYCYSVWMRHLMIAARYGLDADPRDVAELGPGDSIGIGLAALLCGAERYTALDVVAHATLEANLAVFDEIISLLRRRQDIPGDDEFPEVQPKLESYRFPAALLSERRLSRALDARRVAAIRRSILEVHDGSGPIRYRVPWLDADVVEPASQDLILSQAVLEHVDALPETYRAMRLWLRARGHISHQIDFKSHGWANTWDGHWRYGEPRWRLLRGRDPVFINREPWSTHERLIQRAGFRIVAKRIAVAAPSYPRRRLARRFAALTEEDRSAAGVFLLAAHS